MNVMSQHVNAATIAIQPEFGWKRHGHEKGIDLFIKGYGRVQEHARLLDKLSGFQSPPSGAQVHKLLQGLDGHFAIAAKGPGWAFAAVDRVRSIPLAYARDGSQWIIDDQAERLRAGLGNEEINADATLALAMSGYTIDAATLYNGLEQLGPGEFVLFQSGKAPERSRYYTYRPWRSDKPAFEAEKGRQALAETTLSIIDRMMRGIDGRELVVPLSAGRDSRLIVSAAKHLGYDNVRTFAYGRKGNHEAKASKAIAERLGYSWTFVPTGTKFMRDYYASRDWRAYCTFADSLQSVPFVQDLPQIQSLKKDGYIPGDAVFCNGNSGDFISGNHVVPPMGEIAQGLTRRQRLDRITDTLSGKHYSLWTALRTDGNLDRVRRGLEAALARAGAELGDPRDDYGIYEFAEFQDRQCKYVITGQRIYEFLGHEWRLPLWDNDYLDFFEAMPLEAKRGQSLYARMLEEQNWGGVWQDVPVNRETIQPAWIRPVRWIAKAAYAPLGRRAWHRFEKRYLNYWMEQGSQSAISSYWKVACDRRGARHGIAWLVENYLERHGQPLMAHGINE